MSAKPKPRHKAPDTTTWSVIIDGTPVHVTAEDLEPTSAGLIFTTDDTITKLVAAGHWTIVEIVPPPPEE